MSLLRYELTQAEETGLAEPLPYPSRRNMTPRVLS